MKGSRERETDARGEGKNKVERRMVHERKEREITLGKR